LEWGSRLFIALLKIDAALNVGEHDCRSFFAKKLGAITSYERPRHVPNATAI
jgi:hypothetical protein